jgi:hypothetical protein
MMKVLSKRNLPRPDGVERVYIGRPSFWGNPFEIGVHGNRQEVIDAYERYVRSSCEHIASLHELVGKDLVCWCSPLPCHGDVLVKLVAELDGGK